MVQAIDFAVRDSAGGLVRGTVGGETGSNFIQMGSGEEISLNLSQASIVSYERVGDDLVISLSDGGQIKLAGYFAGAEANQLYLSTNGDIALVELSGSEGPLYATYGATEGWDKYSVLDDLRFVDGDNFAQAVAYDDTAGQGLFAPALLGGGLGAGGLAAGLLGGGVLLSGGGGGGGGGSSGGGTGGGGTGGGGTGGGGTGGGTGGGGGERPAPTVDDPTRTETVTTNTVNRDLSITGTGVSGDTVVVTIGTQTQTTTIRTDGTWGVTFPGTSLPPDGNYDSSVVVTPPGLPAIELDGPDYIIDITPPPVTLTSGFERNGDVENLVEHADGVTLTGTSESCATLTVTVGTTMKTVTVGASGTWSVNFSTTELPGGEYTIPAVIRATDALGNVTVVNDRVVIDTVPNTITFNAVTADNTVNGAEATAGFSITGSGTANSTITLTLQGTTKTVTVGADGTWTLSWAAGTLTAGEYDAVISATSTDAAGNVKTATHTMRVDTTTSVAFAATPVEGDNTVNGAERIDGVTLTGTAQPGATVTVEWNGSTMPATVAANGSWTVTFAAGTMPTSSLPVATTATVTARDAVGNTASATKTIMFDTKTSVAINGNQMGGDNIASGAEVANGIVLTGTAEAGASVAVTFDGMTRTVTAGSNGVWSAGWAAAEVRKGEYSATVSVTSTDLAGNTASATHAVQVDTVAPGAPSVISFDRVVDGVRGVGVATTADDLSFFKVGASGAAAAMTATESQNPAFPGETTYSFGSNRVPDGTYLVINTEDAAQNQSSTLFIVNNTSSSTVDLARTGLQDFDLSTINLSFAASANLTITDAQIRSLTGADHKLTIAGGADDTVTMTGAVDTGANVTIANEVYSVYTLGSQGTTILLDDDIQKVI
ncbi:MAG: Ig-like domain-containing protein [Paracoccaceae bacterium]